MGVEVHANIIDNLLHSEEKGRSFLTRGFDEEMIDVGFILLFGLGFGYLFSRVQAALFHDHAVAGARRLRVVRLFHVCAREGRWLSFVIPAGTLAANYAAITSFR